MSENTHSFISTKFFRGYPNRNVKEENLTHIFAKIAEGHSCKILVPRSISHYVTVSMSKLLGFKQVG